MRACGTLSTNARVKNLFPLRYLKVLPFLQERYAARIASNPARFSLELHTEGSLETYPSLFVKSGDELRRDAAENLEDLISIEEPFVSAVDFCDETDRSFAKNFEFNFLPRFISHMSRLEAVRAQINCSFFLDAHCRFRFQHSISYWPMADNRQAGDVSAHRIRNN